MLGVNLESALLSEILHILKEYYVRDELNISDVLLEITKNKEMNIITMFLTEKDRTCKCILHRPIKVCFKDGNFI